MKFVIPGTFTDLNTYSNAERRNRFLASKIKKDETERVAIEAQLNKLPAALNQPLMFHFVWHCDNKRKDPDNISFAKKFILDGLQDAGVITNDGWGQIAGFSDTFILDKDNPRVELIISIV